MRDRWFVIIIAVSVALIALSFIHGPDPKMAEYMKGAPTRGDVYLAVLLLILFRK